MGDDAPAGMPSWRYETSNGRRVVEPRLMVVTICNDNERWPDMKSPNGGLTFRIRPSPPPDCQLRWAEPGIQGTVATLEIILGHTVSTLDDLCYFLYLHAYCRAVFLAAAHMALRRGHAPKEWLNDVLHAAYERTKAELAKGDWRATIADAHGHFGAWLRRFALNRCREALRAQRFAQGFASRSEFLKRIEVADGKLRNHPEPRSRSDQCDLVASMNDAIARLTDAQRYVLLHRTIDAESRATVAAALGISPAKVRILGDQAVHEVRKHLQLGGWLRPFPAA